MKRYLWTIALIGSGLAGLAAADIAPAPGQGTAGVKPPETQSGFMTNRINGRIQSVDTASHQMKIDEKGTVHTLKFTDTATVFVDGRLGSIDDLREGQEVRAAFEERDGQENLRWLDVTAQPEKAAPQPQPAQPLPAK